MKMNLNRAVALTLFIVMSLSVLVTPSLAVTSAETASACKLYTRAKISSKVLANLKKGDTVSIIEYLGNDWARVIADDQEGYIERKNILASTITYTIEPGVTLRSTKMHSRADSESSVLARLQKDAELAILGSYGDWRKVRYNGKDGYILADDVRLGTLKDIPETSIIQPNDVNAAKIKKAQKTNPDVIGWVNVPNTNVDEPVLYAPNYYYADHTIKKKKGYTSTYSHSGNLTQNIAIFGHNIRKSATVFHGLLHLHQAALGYKKCRNSLCRRTIKSSLASWYKTKEGRTWNISIFGLQKWEVFAMYEVPEDEPDSTLRNNFTLIPQNMDKWLQGQLKRSDINFGVSVSPKDQILTLITCGTNYDAADANSRLFVFLKNVD